MRLSISSVLAAMTLAACHPSHDATTDPHGETVSIAPPFDAAIFIADAGVDAARPTETDSPGTVGYVSDGTLIAVGQKVMIARSPDGKVARYRLPEGATVAIAPELRGVVVQTESNRTLVSTPELAVLYDGPGTPLEGSVDVLAVESEHALVFQKGDALARLVLPSDVPLADARALRVVVHETRANVTLSHETDDGMVESAVLYDLATGARIGRGVPSSTSYSSLPVGALNGTVGYVIDGKTVSRIDLERGVVVRRGAVACPADQPIANPTLSPTQGATGGLLLVTCGEDGVVLDATTLATRRRLPSIMPGCDNGPFLGGEILKDGRTLRLDGCGGEAKLDLQTGNYACGDDPGLLGAPYDMGVGLPGRPRMPTGRERVPRCAKGDSQTTRLGSSDTYRLDQSDHYAVVFNGGALSLGDDAGYPVIAPDESEIAYTSGDRVVVRSLPGGKTVTELSLVARAGAAD